MINVGSSLSPICKTPPVRQCFARAQIAPHTEVVILLLLTSQMRFAEAAIMTIPMLPFNLTVGTLGLLLVFRTKASYGRWDEARKLWGLVTNRIR